MARLKRYIPVLTILAAVIMADVAVSQPSAEELMAQAKERAARIAEYRDILNNPDQNVRLAALDIMLQSDDPVMREVAYKQGFISADDTMRAVALRNRLNDLREFTFQLSLTDSPTEVEKQAIVEEFQGIYGIQIREYDVNSGKVVKFNDYHQNSGQVSGISLVLNFEAKRCRGDFTLGDGPVLEGTITCSNKRYAGTYKATAKLI